MVGILDTPELNAAITHMTEDARKFILVISPYLKINARLREIIELADSKGVKSFFVYGKKDMENDTNEWIKTLKHSSISYVEELHAKVYMMELAGIVTSMNLYTYSQVNNEELGVIFEKTRDRGLFKDLVFHAVRIIERSKKEHGQWDYDCVSRMKDGLFAKKHKKAKEVTDLSEQETPVNDNVKEITKIVNSSEETRICHCIRCGRSIPSDHPYVYCGRCLDSWQKYSNFSYVENEGHCYICNCQNKSSAERPACFNCYKNNKDFVITQCDKMRGKQGKQKRL